MSAEAAIQEGNAAIGAAIDAGLGDIAVTSTHVFDMGDHAVDVGTLTGSMGGDRLVGKYVVHWIKTADGWRMHRDIYNFDA